jgi:hypothetical protein
MGLGREGRKRCHCLGGADCVGGLDDYHAWRILFHFIWYWGLNPTTCIMPRSFFCLFYF